MSLFEREKTYRLWDALSQYPVTETDKALHRLLGTVAKGIGAHDAQWIASVRLAHVRQNTDRMRGWRVSAQCHWRPPGPARVALLQRVRRALSEGTFDLDQTVQALIGRAGTFRCQSLRDGFIDLAGFQKTRHWQYFYKELRIVDRIWVVAPLNTEAESWFVFDRSKGRFAAGDVQWAAEALRGLRWFNARLFLSHGLAIGDRPLTAKQRRVATELLTGKEEREIAAQIGQNPRATHQLVRNVYRAFNVKSRAAFMARWFSGI